MSQSSSDDFSVFSNSSKQFAIRREADELYRQNAERMKMKYFEGKCKKGMTFQKGDFVSSRIPRI